MLNMLLAIIMSTYDNVVKKMPGTAETLAFAAAVATEGSAERLDNLGAALLRAGRRGEARDAFERALVLNPGDERARRGAAEARR